MAKSKPTVNKNYTENPPSPKKVSGPKMGNAPKKTMGDLRKEIEAAPENYDKNMTKDETGRTLDDMIKGSPENKDASKEYRNEEPRKKAPYTSPGTRAVIKVRNRQFDKGYTMEHDFNNNGPGVLMNAARALTNTDIHTRIDSQPNGWDTFLWRKQCIKPERERLAVAAAWMIAELDRYYFNEIENNDKEG